MPQQAQELMEIDGNAMDQAIQVLSSIKVLSVTKS
jgi:hypothetical protein